MQRSSGFDVRLVGAGAAAMGGIYCVLLFVHRSPEFKAVLAVPTFVVAMLIAWRALPPWKETERRKLLASAAMTGAAILLAGVVTIVKARLS